MKAIVIEFKHKDSRRWLDAHFLEPFALEDRRQAESLVDMLNGKEWEYRALEKEVKSEK